MSLSSLFFTVVNFVIFVWLCVYFYRKYGKKVLFEHMQAQEEEIRLLEEKAIALKEAEARLTDNGECDARLIASLTQKLSLWRKAADQESLAEQEAQNLIQINLNNKAERQNRWYARHILAQQMLPEVIKKTQGQLETLFDDMSKKQDYMKSVVHFLEKDIK